MAKLPHGDPKGAEEPKPQPSDPTQEQLEQEEEESLDKTIADSFPASDPPSSIPDPDEDESAA
jgi:hypothetical protein